MQRLSCYFALFKLLKLRSAVQVDTGICQQLLWSQHILRERIQGWHDQEYQPKSLASHLDPFHHALDSPSESGMSLPWLYERILERLTHRDNKKKIKNFNFCNLALYSCCTIKVRFKDLPIVSLIEYIHVCLACMCISVHM